MSSVHLLVGTLMDSANMTFGETPVIHSDFIRMIIIYVELLVQFINPYFFSLVF